jgi:alpha-mannosidase
VLRVYEAAGKATQGVKIKFEAKLLTASEANLIEDPGRQLQCQNDTLQFDVRAYEIKTFLLQLQRSAGK